MSPTRRPMAKSANAAAAHRRHPPPTDASGRRGGGAADVTPRVHPRASRPARAPRHELRRPPPPSRVRPLPARSCRPCPRRHHGKLYGRVLRVGGCRRWVPGWGGAASSTARRRAWRAPPDAPAGGCSAARWGCRCALGVEEQGPAHAPRAACVVCDSGWGGAPCA